MKRTSGIGRFGPIADIGGAYSITWLARASTVGGMSRPSALAAFILTTSSFVGTYTKIVEHKRIEYAFGDRKAEVEFVPGPNGIVVRVVFDSEPTHSVEQQQGGWQAILDSFAGYVEAKQKKS